MKTELEAANKRIERNTQLEETQKKRIGSVKDTVETLRERVEEQNVKVSDSPQKQLQDGPGAFFFCFAN